VIGTILSTALLVGPPAVALRVTKRMSRAIVCSIAVGIGATWLGVLLAYDSYYWGSSQNGWPVSFFIVAVVFVTYLASGLARVFSGRRRESPESVMPSLAVDPLDA
jgi:zinc/manganese transport system permease protein